MLHPNQFSVNEAWIAFKINDNPVRTEADGNFNCLALMDGASCFILGTEFIPDDAAEPSQLNVRRLLKAGWSHKKRLPQTLFLPREDQGTSIEREAARQKIEVVRVPESELVIFIGEARQGFRERFE